ncbi:ABC transporter ATP-binding protein [Pontivivens ytuae]|uniref:ABC transporter ATP-binding protein n=1 Tax=Pontivivens ytuae TaxID=2789856 RepID=A0A7S9QDW1_9RHOB|nr:ABC transporter ATP-binding protein [Pontivivens ytuae]QPH55310.1 ABC transporter ATP-binding protein [Pontivivens ytuae]
MFGFFERLVDPYQPYADRDTPPDRLGPFLFEYLRPFRKVLIYVTLFTLVVAAVEIGLIYYAGRVVDLLEGSTPQTFIAEHGLELLFIALFILFLRPIAQIVDTMFLNQSLLPNLGTLVRWRAHRHVLRQSVGWFQDDFAGRIANRVMQTPSATGEATFQVFDALVYAVIYLVGALVLLGGTDPRLMLPLVIWSMMYISLCFYVIPRIAQASKEFSDARSAITGRIVDSYTNIQTVKLFAHTREEELFAGEAIEEARQKFQKQMRLISFMELGLLLINGLLIVAVIGWSVVLWQQGTASVGTVAAASALVLRLNAMTGWIMWALSSLFENLGVVREGMDTIAQPIELTDSDGAADLQVAGGAIAFRDVSHHYGKASGGLEHVELEIPAGQRVGLVGRSGAGKSTMVNLLLRFHDAEKGRIEVDGQAICDVTQDSLRRAVGMVTQDTSLLHRSVRDNIRYGTPGASDAEIEAAARRVEAHDFILELEDPQGRRGYDAHVGERGVKLSGGQRQRIALARVVLKDAPILVLDEATSALDSEVEAAIQGALYGMMEGKTVIAIAHRLSTIAAMDRILVLDGGHVVEDGPHEALLAQGGLYARLWSRQSGGFLAVAE